MVPGVTYEDLVVCNGKPRVQFGVWTHKVVRSGRPLDPTQFYAAFSQFRLWMTSYSDSCCLSDYKK